MSYKLFIDDIRDQETEYPMGSVQCAGEWITVRNSKDAIELLRNCGLPHFIGFDHDLGVSDTSMAVLRWLEHETDHIQANDPPAYNVHSSNPCGSANIKSFMESWRKYRQTID